MELRRIGRALAAMLIFTLVSGCSGGVGKDPESTATRFLQLFDDGDYAAACELMVYTDDTPVSGKDQARKDACVSGMGNLADQAAQYSLDEWRRSPREVQTDGSKAVINFTAVDGRITALQVDGTWYVADPGIGQLVFR